MMWGFFAGNAAGFRRVIRIRRLFDGSEWHDGCFTFSMVAPLRMKSAALSLVVAILALTGGAVFAQAAHPYCVAKQHDCGESAKISSCCCGDQDASWSDSAPVQSRTELRADTTATPVPPPLVHASVTPPLAIAGRVVSTSPPGLCLLDLSTLFATLLI